MKAKTELAKQLNDVATKVWDYMIDNWESLAEDERRRLAAENIRLRNRAEEVLMDALEEGVGGAQELSQKLGRATDEINKVIDRVDKVQQVIEIAVKVSKVAAAIVSGGTSNALELFNKLKVLEK